MAQKVLRAGLFSALASFTNAQFGGGNGSPYSTGNNPFSSGGGGHHGRGDPVSPGGFGFSSVIPSTRMVTAHAALATIAFGLLLPSGGIIIRLGSFRGAWLVHGLFQIFSYLCYVAAAGMGIYMAYHLNFLHLAHPIIGMILLAVLLFQQFLGLLHHFAFKKYGCRTIRSYLHLWIGRIAITLGIINGGLGLRMAKNHGIFPPPQGAIIGYAVAAGIIWLIYVACAVYGEIKRTRNLKAVAGTAPPPYKGSGDEGTRYA